MYMAGHRLAVRDVGLPVIVKANKVCAETVGVDCCDEEPSLRFHDSVDFVRRSLHAFPRRDFAKYSMSHNYIEGFVWKRKRGFLLRELDELYS